MMRRLFTLGLVCLATAGCGYDSGARSADGASNGYRWGTLHRPGIRTVAIPAFQTKSFSRGDEVAVTQALVAQIESRTPYKVVPAERADTILEGMIVIGRPRHGQRRSTNGAPAGTDLHDCGRLHMEGSAIRRHPRLTPRL